MAHRYVVGVVASVVVQLECDANREEKGERMKAWKMKKKKRKLYAALHQQEMRCVQQKEEWTFHSYKLLHRIHTGIPAEKIVSVISFQ